MAGYYEFFAGGGMARAGLGPGWTCLFANDIDPRKAASYHANFAGETFRVCDIAELSTHDLPGFADLAWASFPCQDLSLAGRGAGLEGTRSGAFHPFWRLMKALAAEGRAPAIIAIENVLGLLSSRGGDDFRQLTTILDDGIWRFGALCIDAALFVPQSRPRLFLIGVRNDIAIDPNLLAARPSPPFHPPRLEGAVAALRGRIAERMLWWALPPPAARNQGLSDLLEDAPEGVGWLSTKETLRLVSMMSTANLTKLAAAKRSGRRVAFGLYRRMRPAGSGGRVQRAEIRGGDIAGCLRTPAGGSSRQAILLVEGEEIRTRLISAREAARLMGLADDYVLPECRN
ncbi:MAG: DNA cytosine methyltransferase, partial [Caulobacteraceae bacterium]